MHEKTNKNNFTFLKSNNKFRKKTFCSLPSREDYKQRKPFFVLNKNYQKTTLL